MSTEELLVEHDGPLAIITFNRPEARNAMTWAMYGRLMEVCNTVNTSEEIRILILRGAGGKAFAAGTDISQFQTFQTAEDAIAYERHLEEVIHRVESVTKPTIAAIEGVAAGAGALLALACDLRYCTPESQIGVPIARTLGNCLTAAHHSRLLDLIGPARTKELLFRARLVSAEDAQRLGLVNEVVPAERLHDHVQEIAREIASHAPLTLGVTKEAIRRLQQHRRAVEDEDLIVQAYMSEDFKEGVAAFLEKRPPVFRGR